ncbi:MAG: late competence development ComFB family protein [Oscillospiraceae bacterium]|nr:late competence development ComFB family protein [Oscillospiraceae bacterium]
MASKRMEIDKEAMFRKIMPGSTPPGAASEPTPPAPAEPPVSAVPSPSSILPSGRIQVRKESTQIIANVMERVVLERLDDAFSKFKCCKCDRCRKDVVALALNKLPPRYIVVDEKDISSYAAMINTAEVTTAIVQAVLQVRSNPRH